MQELGGSEGSNSHAAEAETQQQELMAIEAFCQAQKPRVQALHDNVVRVYGNAGGILVYRQSSDSSFLRSARELSSWTRQKIASGSEAAPGQVVQPVAVTAVPTSVASRCAPVCHAVVFFLSELVFSLSSSGSLKRVRASAPDENLLMCNENMGDEA